MARFYKETEVSRSVKKASGSGRDTDWRVFRKSGDFRSSFEKLRRARGRKTWEHRGAIIRRFISASELRNARFERARRPATRSRENVPTGSAYFN